MSKTFIEDLPQRVRVADTDQHTVLLVRELRTGVEGLTRIIQIFQGIFEISALQAIQPVQDLGLSGVYFVRVTALTAGRMTYFTSVPMRSRTFNRSPFLHRG
jgi:hypothetical protein